MMKWILALCAVFPFINLEARVEHAAYRDFYQSLELGDEGSAELNAYFFLRKFPNSNSYFEVAIDLVSIYERQARYNEAIRWLKNLEEEKKLNNETAAKLSYKLVGLYRKVGNQAAAEIHRSLLARKYASTKWGQKVMSE